MAYPLKERRPKVLCNKDDYNTKAIGTILAGRVQWLFITVIYCFPNQSIQCGIYHFKCNRLVRSFFLIGETADYTGLCNRPK